MACCILLASLLSLYYWLKRVIFKKQRQEHKQAVSWRLCSNKVNKVNQ